MSYDAIVIGAGSGGGIVAARLSEDASRSVLLLEAGPDYPTLDELPDDLKYGYATGPRLAVSERHAWRYEAQATPTAPPMPIPRGRVVGGSSAINGQIFIRGLPEDYDSWGDGWSYEDVLPYLLRLEDDRDFSGPLHRARGPIGVRRFPKSEWVEAQRAFFDASLMHGFPEFADANDPDANTGVGPYPLNNPDGIRVSTALAYLAEARGRPNLTLSPDSTVRCVLFDAGRAVGVEFERGGTLHRVRGDEIVLCAGAIETPHLLMLSGVGPAEHLEQLGIPVVADLPGVGENLQDHPMIQPHWKLHPEFTLRANQCRTQVVLRYTAEGSELRDDMWITPLGYQDELMMCSGINLAAGRGRIRLASSDPHVHPVLDYAFAQEEHDRERLRQATHLALALAEQPPLREVLRERLSPTDDELASDEALDAWVQRTVTSSQHISCTAKLGPASDPLAVVDEAGRVHGVDGLRVADASIMPMIVRANTNATALMIGERIAELITGGRP